MSTENLTPQQQTVIIQFITETQEQVDFGELKSAVLEMFEAAQISDIYSMTSGQRHLNFQNFKTIYNLMLKMEMMFQPDMTGVNLL
jgi:hypothetical protein